MSKGFDWFHHNILLSKLKIYRRNDKAIRLLKIIYRIVINMQLGNIKFQLHGISREIHQG